MKEVSELSPKYTTGMISVIIPAYNSADFIENALNSVINQSYDNWEIIIIENGSTDQTTEICNHYINSKIHLYHSEKGVSNARNFGITHSSGEWLLFLDADDTLTVDALSALVNLSKNKMADLIVADYATKHKKYTKKINLYKTVKEIDDYFVFCLTHPTQYCNTAAVLFSHRIQHENNILFDSELNYAEDSAFLIDFLKKSKIILTIDIPVYNYTVNMQSAVRSGKNRLQQAYERSIITVCSKLENESEKIKSAGYLFALNQLLIILVHETCCNKPINQQLSDINKICESNIFNEAINKYPKGLSGKLKDLVFFCMKHKLYYIVMIAVNLRQKQTLKRR